MTGTLTGEQYVALLLERQAEYATGHPLAPAPLLEQMVRPGDEALFTPPAEPSAARRVTRPRSYVPAAELRARRDRLVARRDALGSPVLPEVAAAHGVALGSRRTAGAQAAQDRRLAQWTELHRRVGQLDGRIRRAKARERATS